METWESGNCVLDFPGAALGPAGSRQNVTMSLQHSNPQSTAELTRYIQSALLDKKNRPKVIEVEFPPDLTSGSSASPRSKGMEEATAPAKCIVRPRFSQASNSQRLSRQERLAHRQDFDALSDDQKRVVFVWNHVPFRFRPLSVSQNNPHLHKHHENHVSCSNRFQCLGNDNDDFALSRVETAPSVSQLKSPLPAKMKKAAGHKRSQQKAGKPRSAKPRKERAPVKDAAGVGDDEPLSVPYRHSLLCPLCQFYNGMLQFGDRCFMSWLAAVWAMLPELLVVSKRHWTLVPATKTVCFL